MGVGRNGLTYSSQVLVTHVHIYIYIYIYVYIRTQFMNSQFSGPLHCRSKVLWLAT